MPIRDPEERRAYHREWKRKRREDWFAGKKCVKCGSAEKLELDHIDRTTKVSHNIWSWTEERRLAEIAKCQVLCEQCHQAKTTSERIAHGTLARYTNGCRCEPCRAHKVMRRKLEKRRAAARKRARNGSGPAEAEPQGN